MSPALFFIALLSITAHAQENLTEKDLEQSATESIPFKDVPDQAKPTDEFVFLDKPKVKLCKIIRRKKMQMCIATRRACTCVRGK